MTKTKISRYKIAGIGRSRLDRTVSNDDFIPAECWQADFFLYELENIRNVMLHRTVEGGFAWLPREDESIVGDFQTWEVIAKATYKLDPSLFAHATKRKDTKDAWELREELVRIQNKNALSGSKLSKEDGAKLVRLAHGLSKKTLMKLGMDIWHRAEECSAERDFGKACIPSPYEFLVMPGEFD